jgi:Protein of unknown function (DUF2783)
MLKLDHNLGNSGDDLYTALIAAHDGLDAAASARLNARLVLILLNQVGDAAVIRAAIERARTSEVPET